MYTLSSVPPGGLMPFGLQPRGTDAVLVVGGVVVVVVVMIRLLAKWIIGWGKVFDGMNPKVRLISVGVPPSPT